MEKYVTQDANKKQAVGPANLLWCALFHFLGYIPEDRKLYSLKPLYLFQCSISSNPREKFEYEICRNAKERPDRHSSGLCFTSFSKPKLQIIDLFDPLWNAIRWVGWATATHKDQPHHAQGGNYVKFPGFSYTNQSYNEATTKQPKFHSITRSSISYACQQLQHQIPPYLKTFTRSIWTNLEAEAASRKAEMRVFNTCSRYYSEDENRKVRARVRDQNLHPRLQ